MCNFLPTCNHDRISGKNAVIALAEIDEGSTKVCEARLKFVLAQCRSFVNWLAEQPNNSLQDAKDICRHIYEETLAELKGNALDEFIWTASRENSDNLTDTMAGKDDDRAFESGETDGYWGALHVHAYAGWKKSLEEPTFFEEQMVAFLEQAEIEYQAGNEYLSKATWKKVRVARQWINNQRRTKLIDFETFCLLANWANKLLGNSKRYDVPEEEEEVYQDALDQADVEVYYTRD